MVSRRSAKTTAAKGAATGSGPAGETPRSRPCRRKGSWIARRRGWWMSLALVFAMVLSLLQAYTPTVAAASSSVAAITVTVSSASVPADGSTSATVTASVSSGSGQPVAGIPVSFATTLGTLSAPSAVTDGQGEAVVTVTSTATGVAVVTATATNGAPSGSAQVSFTAPLPAADAPARVVVVAAPTTAVAADGTSAATVTATVYDAAGAVLPAITVDLATTLGGFVPGSTMATKSVTTDVHGVATASLVATNPGTAAVTATAGGVSGSAAVTFVAPGTAPKVVFLSVSPLSVPADGTSAATVTATVYDATGVVGAGVAVAFSSTLGTLGARSAPTNASGQATVTITSTSAGTAAVTATAGSAAAAAQVAFTALTTAPQSVAVRATPAVLPPDGSSLATVTATVYNRQGLVIPDADATWATTLGAIGPCLGPGAGPFFRTGASGEAVGCLTSKVSGTAVVTVAAGSVSGSTAVVFSTAAAVTSVVVVVSPGAVAADGTSAATVTATVYGAAWVLPDVPVTLTTTLGSFSPTSSETSLTLSTDAAGQAAASLTSTTAGEAAVTARSGSAAGAAGVVFTATGASTRSVLLTASPASVPADGLTAATLMVTVDGPSGAPLPGASVDIGTTLGSFAGTGGSTTASLTTDAAGKASISLSSGTPGTAAVAASSGSASSTATVTFTAAPPSRIVLATAPGSVPADGGTAAKVTALVYDTAGGLLQGVPVTFTTTIGTFCNAGPYGNCPWGATATVATGEAASFAGTLGSGPAGQASLALASSTTGTATIVATAGGAAAAATVAFSPSGPVSSRLSVAPGILPGDGTATATVTTVVYDAAGAALPGTYVTVFSRGPSPLLNGSPGAEGVTVETDAAGIATLTLTAPEASGVSTLTAVPWLGNPNGYWSHASEVPAAEAVATVGFTPAEPVTLAASATSVPADGVSGASLTVTVGDAPLANQEIQVSTTLGSLLYPRYVETGSDLTVLTDGQGRASFVLTSATAGTAVVTATVGGESVTATVTFTPSASGRVALVASPGTVPADGTSEADVVAAVYDGAGAPLPGALVVLQTEWISAGDAGVIFVGGVWQGQRAVLSTGAGGTAAAAFRSSAPGLTLLQAESGAAAATAPVRFVPATPGSIQVGVAPAAVPADGTSRATVTATVYDTAGAPLAGVQVALETSLGLLKDGYTWDLLTTNAAGQVSETLTSSAAGSARITAIAWMQQQDGGWTPLQDTTSLTFTPPGEVGAVGIRVAPASAPADGVSPVTVTATVTGTDGLPLAGVTVSFSATGGVWAGGCSYGGWGCLSSATTDASGAASLALTSTQAGALQVTAAADGVAASATATFTPPPTAVASLSLTAGATTLIADGGTTTLTVTALSGSGQPVPDAVVGLDTSHGCFESILFQGFQGLCETSADVTTDSQGKVSVTFGDPSYNDTGQAIVEASLNDGSSYATQVITFVPAPDRIVLAATPGTLPADGVHAATVTATVYDALGDPVPGVSVDLQSSLGDLAQNTYTTDGAGQVTGSVSASAAGTATLTASAEKGYVEGTTSVVFTPVPARLALSVTPAEVPANGMDQAAVVATVYGPDGKPAPGVTVALFTTLGAFVGSGSSQDQLTTDASGQVRQDLVATGAGTAALTATALGVAATGVVEFTLPATNPVTLSVTASPPGVPADGVSTTAVTVQVLGADGAPVSGACLTLVTTLGVFADGAAYTVVCSDASGAATGTLRSATPGVAAVTATDGLASGAATATFTAPPAGPPASLTVTATPGTVPADGVSAATVTVTVLNAAGDPLAGQDVTVTTTAGEPSASQVTTGPAGSATVTVADAVPGEVFVSAAVADLAGTAAVDFSPEGASPSAAVSLALHVSPASTPADGVSAATVTAVVYGAAGEPLGGVPVFFGVSGGSLAAASATTDAEGVASVGWTSPVPGKFSVTATTQSGALSAAATEEFTPPAARVTVTAAASSLPADGVSSTVVSAGVIGQDGAPLAGVPVTFTFPGQQPTTALTDAAGLATATFVADRQAGVATLEASVGSVGGAATITLTPLADRLVLVASPASVPADGVTAAVLTATVYDQLGKPVPGVNVAFYAALGTLLGAHPGANNIVTGSDGAATMPLVSTSPGVATVTASSWGLNAATTVSFTPSAATGSLSVSAAPGTIPADGETASTLAATVRNPAGTAVAGLPVTFCTSLGGFAGPGQASSEPNSTYGLGYACTTAPTGADGTATVPIDSSSPGIATVSAAVGSLSAKTAVTFGSTAAQVALAVSPARVLADGSSAATVTAVVYGAGGAPLPGVTVTFRTTLGLFAAGGLPPSDRVSLTTASDGVVSARLTSATPGPAEVTASAEGGVATSTAAFVSAARIVLGASSVLLPADGVTASTVTAVVYGAGGTPLQGAAVEFQTTLGELSASTAETDGTGVDPTAVTDATGAATVRLTSTSPGTALVTASVAGASAAAEVTFTAGALTVALSARPGSVPADGVSPAVVTATVMSAVGAPVAGSFVDFQSTFGEVSCSGTCRTDPQGQAQALVSSAVPGTAVVVATAGSSSGAAAVTFTPSVPGRVLLSVSPPSVPADGRSAATATAVVYAGSGSTLAGVPVNFHSDLGSFRAGSWAITDSQGVAQTQITATTPGTAAVTAEAGAVADSATLTFGASSALGGIVLAASPGQVPVGAAATVTATVYGPGGVPVGAGTVVTLTTSRGLYQRTCTWYPGATYACPSATISAATDAAGQVIATLTSQATGTAQITATTVAVSGQAELTFVNPVARLTLTASPNRLPANGVDRASLTATAYGAGGEPLAGRMLSFASTLGTFTSGGGTNDFLTTNAQGQVTGSLSSTAPGTAEVVVRPNGVAGGPAAAVPVTFTALGASGSVLVTASPTAMPADGVHAATVTATVYGAGGAPVAGVPVVFQGFGGGGALSFTGCNVGQCTTDASGEAGVEVTGTSPGTYVVTASAGTSSGSAILTLQDVLPPVPAAITLATSPAAVQADGASAVLVTAAVTDAAGQPLPGANVTLTTSDGLFTARGNRWISGTTDAAGRFSATIASTSAGVAALTASAGSVAASAEASFTRATAGILLAALPLTVVADGKSAASVTATVLGAAGVPEVGAVVAFTASLGALSGPTATTDGLGQATITLTSAAAGIAAVTASADGYSRDVAVRFTPASGTAATVSLAATPQSLPADGAAQSTLTVVVTGADGLPQPGATVDFTTTLGSLSAPEVRTDTQGVATVTLMATAPGTASVTAAAAGGTATTSVSFTALALALSASPATLPADGRSSSIVAAVVTSGGVPLSDVPVTFAATLGSLSGQQTTTDAEGVATVTLTAATAPGMATLTAAAFGATATASVPMGQGQLTLRASTTSLPADGASRTTVTATVTGPDGKPAADVPVSFTATAGTLAAAAATTDAQGLATVTLTASPTPGVATVTATAAGSQGSLRVTFFGLKLHLVTSVTVLPADGKSEAAVTATLTDAAGIPVPGVALAATVDLGTLSRSMVETDASGNASLTYTAAAKAGTATVTATVGSVSASATITLAAGTLLFSDQSGASPVWGEILPAPGQGSDQGRVAPFAFAGVQFTLDYSAGQHLTLSGDPYAQSPFCVDGRWRFQLFQGGTVVAATYGGGCDEAPVDLAGLNIPSGTYGGVLTLTAPATGTSYGAGSLYLVGFASGYWMQNLPNALAPLRAVGKPTSIPVGSSGVVPVVSQNETMPVGGVHTEVSWDPTAIAVSMKAAPGGWGFQGGWVVPGHTGSIFYPAPEATVGSELFGLQVTCLQPGTWPVSFAGTWWPHSGFGTQPLSATVEVACTAPTPGPSTVEGATVDPADGSLYLTVTGTNLAAAAKATLTDGAGTVAATTTSFTVQQPTVVTAHFPAPVPAGLYTVTLYDAAGDVLTAEASGVAVPPALPLFNLQQADLLGQKPGQAVTHFWRLTNYGPVDGTAVVLFAFPGILAVEPALDTAALPAGSWLLVHGTTPSGWYEIVAVPLQAGESTDIAWTETVNPLAVFGSGAVLSLGESFPTVSTVVDGVTAAQWAGIEGDAGLTATSDAAAMTSADWSAALAQLGTFTGTQLSGYQAALSATDPTLVTQFFDTNSGGFWDYLFNFGGGSFPIGYPAGTPDPASSDPTSTAGGVALARGDPGSGGSAVPDPGVTSVLNAEACLLLLPICDAGDYVVQQYVQMKNCGFGTYLLQHNSWLDWLLSHLPGGQFASKLVQPGSWYGQMSHTINWPIVKQGIEDYGVLTQQWFKQNPAAIATAFQADPALAKQDCFTCYLDVTSGNQVALQTDIQNNFLTIRSKILDPEIAQIPVPPQYLNQNNADGLTQYILGQSPAPPGTGGFANYYDALQVSHAIWYLFTGNSNPTFKANGQLTSLPSGALNHGMAILEMFRLDAAYRQSLASYSGTLAANSPFGGNSPMPTWFNACNDINLTGGYDPNAISANPGGAGGQGVIPAGTPITYTVRFENTGNAPVTDIRVVLKLDPALDPTTLASNGSSFAGTQFAYDPATGTVTWFLPEVNLPPSTNPPAGEGWVSLKVTPKADLPSGTAVTESADVYFDYNPPVATGTVTRTLDTTPPTVTMASLPASEPAGPLTLSWQGHSAVGIQQYTLYLSQNGGPLEPWASTAGTSYTLTLAAGHTYGVGVQATDVAGLSSSAPSEPQASFSVPSVVPAVSGISPSSGPAAGGTPVTISGTDFTSQATVHFGPNAATDVAVASSTQLSATAPAGSGTVDVTVTTAAGQSAISAADHFTYTTVSVPSQETVPAVSGISPSSGPAAGGTPVTISGADFTSPATVHFGPNAATNVAVASSTQLTATAPAGSGTVDVTVTTAAGTSAAGPADQFSYIASHVVPFSDVPSTFWAYADIQALKGAGIVSGFPDGTFQPNANATRAQFVKMLVLTVGLTPSTGTTPFADAPPSAWYAPYVSAAVKAGIVRGLSLTTFGPNETVTREQMVVMVARALNLTQTTTLHFSDAATIDPWALRGVEEAAAAGYIHGFPNGTFQPLAPATRAQAAKVLAAVLSGEAPSTKGGSGS